MDKFKSAVETIKVLNRTQEVIANVNKSEAKRMKEML
jgi:hypothetical protein